MNKGKEIIQKEETSNFFREMKDHPYTSNLEPILNPVLHMKIVQTLDK